MPKPYPYTKWTSVFLISTIASLSWPLAAGPRIIGTNSSQPGTIVIGPTGTTLVKDTAGPPEEFTTGEFLVKFKPQGEDQVLAGPPAGRFSTPTTSVISLKGLEAGYKFRAMKRIQEDRADILTRRLKAFRPASVGSSSPKRERLRLKLEAMQKRALLEARGGVYKLRFDIKKEKHEELLKSLRANGDVEWAQLNHVYHTRSTLPDDPSFGQQAFLSTIKAPEAWDLTTGSDAVTVAVIDVGVDWTHPDLAENIWTNPGEIPGDGIDNDGNGFIDDVRGWDFVEVDPAAVVPGEDYAVPDNDPMDFLGHGTHVAGIIAARGNNGLGVTGVNWRAKVMALRAGYGVPGGGGALTDEAINSALHYAAMNGADIVNMSFGSPYASPIQNEAIEFAHSAGCILVAAAGNSYSQLKFYPADLDHVISVAATNNNYMTYFSNFGANIDIAAPGWEVLSTLPNNGYGTESGTSMASPVVAGVAALILATHPEWTPDWVTRQLLSTATSIDDFNPRGWGKLGAGMVDASAALGPEVTSPTVKTTHVMTQDNQGDQDGVMEPGETVDMLLTIRNFNADNTFNAIVSTSDPYIQMVSAAADYGTLPEGRSKTNSGLPFTFRIAETVPANHAAVFTADIFNAGIKVSSESFTVNGIADSWGRSHVFSTSWQADGNTLSLPDGRLFMVGATMDGSPLQGIVGAFRELDGTWSPVERLNPASQTAYSMEAINDEMGNIYLAYTGIATTYPDCEIFLRKYDYATKTWGDVTQVTMNSDPILDGLSILALTAQPGGKIYLAWVDTPTEGASICTQTFDGNSWGPKTAVHAAIPGYVVGVDIKTAAGAMPILMYTADNFEFKRDLTDGDWGPEVLTGDFSWNTGRPFVKGDGIYRLNTYYLGASTRLEKFSGTGWALWQNLYDNPWGTNHASVTAPAIGLFDENNFNLLYMAIGPHDPSPCTFCFYTGIFNLYGREKQAGSWSEFVLHEDYAQNINFPTQKALAVDGVRNAYSAYSRYGETNAQWIYRTTEPVATEHIPTKPVITINSILPDVASIYLNVDIASTHPQGIRYCEFAIGTQPGGNDIQDWNFLPVSAFSASINRADVPENQEFYLSARTHSNGVYSSATSISNPLYAPRYLPPSITVTPLSLSATLLAGSAMDLSLSLSNSGTVEYLANLTPTNVTGPVFWLSTAGTNFPVDGGASVTANVHLDATGLPSGSYTGEIRINHTASNVPSPLIVPVNLTVNTPPLVLTQPVDVVVNAGSNATFSMTAGGDAPLTYKWFRAGSTTVLSTTPTLTISPVLASDNGSNFLCQIYNPYGATKTRLATLTVNVPPTLTSQPADIGVAAGEKAVFAVTATGTSPLTYRWFLKGSATVLSTTNQLTLAAPALMDNGKLYYCVVANGAGSITSREAKLTVGIALPGKLQAEDYKTGGEGVGYHDLTAGNSGGKYRADNVDIESTSDVGGGFDVGWIQAGEWLAYDVKVAATGLYTFTARIASGTTGTKSTTVLVDNQTAAVFSTTDASGSQSFKDVTVANVSLTAGMHQLRINMTTGNFNWNYLNVATKVNQPPVANAGTDKAVVVNTNVTLDGRASTDPDAYPAALTYAWTLVAGPATVLVGANTSQPAFTPTVEGAYTFRLTVSDGAASATDDVLVTVNPATPYINLPGRIQAEDYKSGGEGVGYHDLTTGNSGGKYRTENVDIEATSDAGGGYNVGWIQAGEWLAFDVKVASAGPYIFTARLASGVAGTKTATLSVDGVNAGTFTFTDASGYQSFKDVVYNSVSLSSGTHVLRLTMNTGNFNVNYMDVAPAPELILNGNFGNALTSWQNAVGGGAAATFTNDAGAGKIAITAGGVNTYDIEFFQAVALKSGKVYSLEFDMKSEATPKSFKVVVEHNGTPWTKYFESTYSITTGSNNYQHFKITWTQVTADTSVRLGFHFGISNLNDCWLDNVSLK